MLHFYRHKIFEANKTRPQKLQQSRNLLQILLKSHMKISLTLHHKMQKYYLSYMSNINQHIKNYDYYFKLFMISMLLTCLQTQSKTIIWDIGCVLFAPSSLRLAPYMIADYPLYRLLEGKNTTL